MNEFFNDTTADAASWRASESEPSLYIRLARRVRDRLDGMRFLHTPGEKLVGRIDLPTRNPAEVEALPADLATYLRWIGQTGHCEPCYDEIFAVGIGGIRERLDRFGGEAHRCFAIALEGLSAMIGHAADAVAPHGDVELTDGLRRLAAGRPPATFRQALNLMWFIMLGIQFADRAVLVGPGRLDRRLIAFYERDLKAGILNRDDACELLATFYLYINDSCHSGLAYPVMVGGSTPVNDLSYLALEALRPSFLSYPSVGVCVNGDTPEDLLKLAVEIIAEGSPCPAFFNDSLIRRGLEHYGVPHALSGEYINSTCVEITPSGRSNVAVASPYYNLGQTLLEVMDREYADFDSLLAAFRAKLEKAVEHGAADIRANREFRQKFVRRPLQSVFTLDCIGRGRDIEDGGAEYNWGECSFVGLANCVDSLYVIREEVFNRSNFGVAEFAEILRSDFAGREPLRRKCLDGYPKYGQGDARVDSLIPPLVKFFEELCGRFRLPPDDSPYIPGTFCWIMHERLGGETGATADGRHAGFPFADGAGPAQGREKFGPTTAIASVCSFDHSRLIGGSAFNMKFPKTVLSIPENRAKLVALVRGFIAGGGFETQINVADSRTLREAMAHPEAYRDLVVRIGGYTDYFTRLSSGMQHEVLLRTEYSAL